jgi:hypothetical protein
VKDPNKTVLRLYPAPEGELPEDDEDDGGDGAMYDGGDGDDDGHDDRDEVRSVPWPLLMHTFCMRHRVTRLSTITR